MAWLLFVAMVAETQVMLMARAAFLQQPGSSGLVFGFRVVVGLRLKSHALLSLFHVHLSKKPPLDQEATT